MNFFILISNVKNRKKKALILYFVAAISFICLGGLFNVVIDPEEIYIKKVIHDNNLNRYAGSLLESRNGLLYSPLERGVKYHLAKESNAECFFFGSSRAMQYSLRKRSWISNDCLSLTNLGVSGGSIEDVVIFSSAVFQKNKSKLYLVFDPWMLSLNSDVRWQEYDYNFYEFLSLIGYDTPIERKSFFVSKLKNVFNIEYLQASYEFFGEKGLNALPEFDDKIEYAIDFDIDAGYQQAVTLADGSHVYASSYIEGATGRDVINGGYRNYRLEKYNIDDKAVELIDLLIKKLKEKHEVNIAMTPFHPEQFSGNDDFVDKVSLIEAEIRLLGQNNGINVIGSFRPDLYGCSEEDFLDAIHAKFSCIKKIVDTDD